MASHLKNYEGIKLRQIAFVHDWLITKGGAENVLAAMLELWPHAPVFTLIHNLHEATWDFLKGHEVHTSFLQRIPVDKQKYRSFLPLMPLAIEQFDLSDYEILISSSHAVAKGVLARADQLHISYIHTPIRYAWDLYFQYLREAKLNKGLKSWLARIILHYIRIWDCNSTNRVDVFIANSHYIANRVWRVYRRRAKVIYPPVEVDHFRPNAQRDDFYLTVSRLVPYKKVDLIVEAFTRMGKPLVVIGDGPENDKIKLLAGSNVRLLGYQPDKVVKQHMELCKAFVFASEEDFGIVPVEAQAAGAPVIAYGKGGVLETVLPGETGVFYYEQNVEALVQAVQLFESQAKQFHIECIRKNAERFAKERFQHELIKLVEQKWEDFRKMKLVD